MDVNFNSLILVKYSIPLSVILLKYISNFFKFVKFLKTSSVKVKLLTLYTHSVSNVTKLDNPAFVIFLHCCIFNSLIFFNFCNPLSVIT